MHNIVSASSTLFILGFACFAAFSWGVKAHFRSTGAMPKGMKLISSLSLGGFLWFGWRLATGPSGETWEVSMILFAAALALFAWTVRSTRQTPPTLAFDSDEPSFLLHQGPYQYVRHPFYLSYLLFWTGTALASPGLSPWLAPTVMLLVYWHAASREELKFARSNLANSYEIYRIKAGMFLPKFGLSLTAN
jgi:protein-S-isoprenylcysteine O-methyltransferase Ste14